MKRHSAAKCKSAGEKTSKRLMFNYNKLVCHGEARQNSFFILRCATCLMAAWRGGKKKRKNLAGKKKEANCFSWCERERELLRVGGRLIRMIKT